MFYDLERDLIKHGVTCQQVDCVYKYIIENYSIYNDPIVVTRKVQELDDSSYLINLMIEEFCNIKLFPHAILVDKNGNCVELDYPIANYFNKDLILVSKLSDIVITNSDNPECYKEYSVVEKQAIVDSKGNIIYDGELGDINGAQLIDGYLLLKKAKYSELQKEQINYYLENCVPERYDYSDYIECPDCKGDAEWEESQGCYICDNCKKKINDKHISREEADERFWEKLATLTNSNFEEVFNFKDIKRGLFITDTPEEREERKLVKEQLKELDYDVVNYYDQDDRDTDDYIFESDECLYSVYNTYSKKVLFPFQPCKIKINPSGMPKGIYLGNERDLSYLNSGFKYEQKTKSFSWILYPDPFGDGSFNSDIKTFNGQMFISIYDTFRTGPHTGLSLKQVFERQPKTIIKYVSLNHIFISSEALQQLGEIYHERYKTNFTNLIITRDSKLRFSRITSFNDRVLGRGAYEGVAWYSKYVAPIICTSLYCDKTFYELFLNNPQYIIGLAMLNDSIEITHEALSGIECLPRYDELKRIVERNINRQEEREQHYWSMVAEDMDKEIIELGFKTAFEGNPDLIWNID